MDLSGHDTVNLGKFFFFFFMFVTSLKEKGKAKKAKKHVGLTFL